MRFWSKWSSPFRGSIFAVALGLSALSLSALSLSAQAQSADAGASAPAEPTEPAGNDPRSDPPGGEVDRHAAAPTEPPPPPGLKTLSSSQRLPENLQGWMRERQRRNPALVERHPVSESHPTLAPKLSDDDPSVAAIQRRLRSFSENGVTVLSNRQAATGPVGPALTRVAAAAAVSRPAPAQAPAAGSGVSASAVAAADTEEHELPADVSVEMRSLHTQSASSRTTDEGMPRWPAWLAMSAALGLFVVWLRKRRAAA